MALLWNMENVSCILDKRSKLKYGWDEKISHVHVMFDNHIHLIASLNNLGFNKKEK